MFIGSTSVAPKVTGNNKNNKSNRKHRKTHFNCSVLIPLGQPVLHFWSEKHFRHIYFPPLRFPAALEKKTILRVAPQPTTCWYNNFIHTRLAATRPYWQWLGECSRLTVIAHLSPKTWRSYQVYYRSSSAPVWLTNKWCTYLSTRRAQSHSGGVCVRLRIRKDLIQSIHTYLLWLH